MDRAAQAHHQVDVVLHQEHRDLPLPIDLPQGLLELLGLRGVETRGRFVEQHHGRFGREGPTELEEPGGPEREPERRAARDRTQAEQLEQPVDRALLGRVGPPKAPHGEQVRPGAAPRVLDPVREDQVLADGQPGEELRVLEGTREPVQRTGLRARVGDVDAVEGHRPPHRPKETGKDTEESALPRPVRADQPDDLRGWHGE